jgi:hypothetical protein
MSDEGLYKFWIISQVLWSVRTARGYFLIRDRNGEDAIAVEKAQQTADGAIVTPDVRRTGKAQEAPLVSARVALVGKQESLSSYTSGT